MSVGVGMCACDNAFIICAWWMVCGIMWACIMWGCGCSWFFYMSECVRAWENHYSFVQRVLSSEPASTVFMPLWVYSKSQFKMKLYIKDSEGDVWKFSWMVCPSLLAQFTLPFGCEDHALILRILLCMKVWDAWGGGFRCSPWCTSRGSIRDLDTVLLLSQWPLQCCS